MMVVALASGRRPSREHVTSVDQKLADDAGVVASGLECFDIGLPRGGEHLRPRCRQSDPRM